MTSAWVLIIASLLHFGVRRSCFLNMEQLPVVPDTLFARHIAYCAILHFLYDQELLPMRYRRRMSLLIGFLVELVLGVAFMEVLGQWLWFRMEHLVYRCFLLALRTYGGEHTEMLQSLELVFMRGVMTTLAALLWLNAYAATEPNQPEEPQVAPPAAKASMVKLKHRPQTKRNEQQPSARRLKSQEQASQQDQKQKQKMKLKMKQKAEQNRKQQKQAEYPELPVAEDEVAPLEEQQQQQQQQQQHLTATSDC